MTTTILPVFDYDDYIYQFISIQSLHKLDVFYNSCCRFVLECPTLTHHCNMYVKLGWLSLTDRRLYHWYCFVFKFLKGLVSCYLTALVNRYDTNYNLRSCDSASLVVPRVGTCLGKMSFAYRLPKTCNSFNHDIRSTFDSLSFKCFKNDLCKLFRALCKCFDPD